MDPYKILFFPFVSEKSSQLIEENNSLEFVVRRGASKKLIKHAAEQLFEVKVDRVNTRITKEGKRAIIKLNPDYKTEDIATRIGIF
jgi:large subunit ribosomal protein L23